jgi:hypothetical protein
MLNVTTNGMRNDPGSLISFVICNIFRLRNSTRKNENLLMVLKRKEKNE